MARVRSERVFNFLVLNHTWIFGGFPDKSQYLRLLLHLLLVEQLETVLKTCFEF
jgi:hypothetical protein